MRFQHVAIAFGIAVALAIPATPVFAQGRGWAAQEGSQGEDRDWHGDQDENHDHGRGRGHHKDRDHHDRDRRYFRDRDRDVISGYYRDRRDLPPGLARREELPPGLERQLRRNGTLPPGLRARIVWLPADLDRRLGPLPYGYRRCWLGNDVLVVNPRSYAIVDVMVGVHFSFH